MFEIPSNQGKRMKQAGTELGQAQLKLGLDFNFCRFGFFGFSLIDLVWYKFDLVDLVWYIGFCKLGSLAS